MAMDKQMSLFQEGGLLDEGGTVDEVSGNEVPAGSLKEEVRDDIPAQLSEGEFVMPADVVRYHGLDKMMALRDEAKAGLQRMEAMGQMGNSEDAVLPDDVPFDMNDLEVEDDENEPLEMQGGGFVQQQPYGIGFQQQPYGTVSPRGMQPMQGTGTFNVQSQFANYSQQPGQQFQPFQPTQPQPQPGQPVMPSYMGQPTGGQPTYTFEQMMPTVGSKSETREYRNEAGQVLYIPFIGGKPVYPIPDGYTEYRPEATAPVEPPTDTTAPTTVTDSGGGDDDRRDPFATMEEQRTQSQRVESTTNELGVTGNRGINLGTAMTAIGMVVNPAGAIAGMIGKGLAQKAGIEVPSIFGDKKLGAKDPLTELSPEISAARQRTQSVTGQSVSGYVGNQVGDIDPVTGGIFGAHGVALDTKTGFARVTTDGTKSFNSFDTAKTMMGAALPEFMGGTGYYGGIPDATTFSSLSQKGKENVASYLNEMEKRTDTPFAAGSTVKAIQTYYAAPIDVSAMDPAAAVTATAQQSLDKKAAAEILNSAMSTHVVENTNLTSSSLNNAPHVKNIGAVLAGTQTPKAAMDAGVTVDSFNSATEAAKAGIGYSSYDANGNPTGAAPAGSGYSKTGKFSSGSKDRNNNDNKNDDSTGSGFYGGSAAMETAAINDETISDEDFWSDFETDPNTKNLDSSSSDSSSDKIVCTEMYRQTQLNDWTKAIKIWDVYQKKHLTPYHEKGYHWLFKPYVQGMKKSNLLTKLGAYLAKQRTQHLRHVLTKGRAKDSIVGNIWCKIIHPIVYVAGRVK
jgi:hypothetical protein